MIDVQLKDEFWEIVEDCLTDIHQLSVAEAVQRSRDLRRRLKARQHGVMDDMIYHAEPFDIACDLADSQLEIDQHEAVYNEIVSRHNW